MRYPEPAVGQRLTAEFIASMLPNVYRKDNTTARNTTTTLTDDPDLQAIPLAIGRYEIELTGYFTQTTTTTQRIKVRWGFTGTWDNQIRAIIGPGAADVGSPNSATTVNIGAVQASGQDAIYSVAAGGTYGNFREIGIIEVSAPGNLSMQWAQFASSANNTTVYPGTAFKVIRIA